MKCSIYVVAALLLTSVSCSLATEGDDHPVTKVIQLLQSLQVKVESQGKTEGVTYSKFEYWCTNSLKTVSAAIAENKANIEALEARIAALTERAATLKEQIEDLADQILDLKKREAKANRIRKSEAALYKTADADFISTIAAVAQALQYMETAEKTTEGLFFVQEFRAGASSKSALNALRQALSFGMPATATTEERAYFEALTEQLYSNSSSKKDRPDFKAKGEYEKHIDKYDFKSHKVIELLKDLQKKFEDEHQAAITAETNSINAFALAKQARDDELKQAGLLKKAKEGDRTDTLGELKTANADIKNDRADLAADEKTLEQTQKDCAIKKTEWAERSETRKLELEAMDQAIKILSEVTGVRDEAPTNPVPPPSPVSFLQVASVTDPKMQAVELLRKSARATKSKALGRLADEINKRLGAPFDQGPFNEVNNMIEKMIFRLMQEQKDEDDHKNWCDLELSKTDESISDKADKMQELKNKIDEAQARIAELTVDIKDANEMAATITDHMGQASEIRAIGKQENAEAVKDSAEAQTAIANAIAVLDSFYKDSGMVKKEAWEFVQQPVVLKSSPSTWGKSYTGITDPMDQPKGIISVLTSMAADFAEMESQTQAAEATDQAAFEDDMKDCKIERARRLEEAQMKDSEKQTVVAKVSSMQDQRKGVSKEHETTQQYLKDLQHACVDGDSTYKERSAARETEVAALKQAQIILRDAFKEKSSSFLQRRN